MVGHREVDEGLAEDGAQARLVDRARGVGLEVVHVGEGRRAALDHLEGGEQRAVVDELGRDVLALGGKDVLGQPLVERQVVGEPRRSVIAAWVCVLTRPGSTMRPWASYIVFAA